MAQLLTQRSDECKVQTLSGHLRVRALCLIPPTMQTEIESFYDCQFWAS
jgi:hypothetical protein